jgi:hypothetical protein
MFSSSMRDGCKWASAAASFRAHNLHKQVARPGFHHRCCAVIIWAQFAQTMLVRHEVSLVVAEAGRDVERKYADPGKTGSACQQLLASLWLLPSLFALICRRLRQRGLIPRVLR